MDTQMVHIVMPKSMIRSIDDFRFAHRFESRAAAIRALIDMGLEDANDVDAAIQAHQEDPSKAIPFDDYLATRDD